MWTARDKSGRLFLYYTKPKRRKDNWHEKGTPYLQLDKTLFPELKWEDNPVEVKLVPSSFDVIEKFDDFNICDIERVNEFESGISVGWQKCYNWIKSKIVK